MNSIIVIINYIIVIYITYNFDHRSVTECNRKIVTTLKILNNLCWPVQFYCSEGKFTMLLRFFCSLSTHTNTYMVMKNIYIYMYIN